MNIITSFNDDYLLPEKTMIKSLLCNNTDLKIYVLYSELLKSSINSIMEFAKENATKIHFIRIETERLSNFPLTELFPVEIYFRLFAYKYLPLDVDRALWLDSDIIVNGSLTDFYTQSFGEKLFIAVKDAGYIKGEINRDYKVKIGMPENAIYVNSGVLLLNIGKMRRTITESAIHEYVEKYNETLHYFDQDILNAVYWNKIKVSSEMKYNFQLSAFLRKKVKKYISSAVILHYTGPKKPWRTNYYKSGFKEYWHYAKQIPELKKSYSKILVTRLFYSAFVNFGQIPVINRLLYKIGRLR